MLSLVFLSGKVASAFVGHNTLREPAFSGKKQSTGSVPLCGFGVPADYSVDLEQLLRMVYLRFWGGYRREYSGGCNYLQFEYTFRKAVNWQHKYDCSPLTQTKNPPRKGADNFMRKYQKSILCTSELASCSSFLGVRLSGEYTNFLQES